jgi:hypothetical protein
LITFLAILCLSGGYSGQAGENSFPVGRWNSGALADSNFFPLAVWLQSPANADKYRAAGINVYVGLWRGPTADQLDRLKLAGMRVICDQNEIAQRPEYATNVIAWMHGDEPDNAQELKGGKGYGPPIPPEKIVNDYLRLREADPSRPVLLNLGQGVAWDGWYGRGVRTGHPEDYPKYIQGCDIVSFDIYPAVHDRPEIAGNLWYVAKGVERLVKWSEGKKLVWNCLECTRIGNPDKKPTPDEVRAEAWMSIIHGSRGLIYFVHQFQPTFREAGLLDDPEMLAGVTALNRQITELAPIINSAPLDSELKVSSTRDSVPIAATMRRFQGSVYLFAVGMRGEPTTARFASQYLQQFKTVAVLGENRTLEVENASFKDEFGPYSVHLYRIDPQRRRRLRRAGKRHIKPRARTGLFHSASNLLGKKDVGIRARSQCLP